MSQSKRDILETENMLQRLVGVLHESRVNAGAISSYELREECRADAESLRRISMTLHRWHELECGDSNDSASWCIARGRKDNGGAFEYDDSGAAFLEIHYHHRNGAVYRRIPDRESGARKRLAKIMARYPSLQAYVQTDPRGCALYILRPGDVPEGADVSSCYRRGIAVHR